MGGGRRICFFFLDSKFCFSLKIMDDLIRRRNKEAIYLQADEENLVPRNLTVNSESVHFLQTGDLRLSGAFLS